MTARPGLLAALLSVVLVFALPAAARAEDPPFVDWASLLEPLPGEYSPSREKLCRSGDPRCVDLLIKTMDRRMDWLARRCDHDVIFELLYLRTTEEYRRAAAEPDFFEDPRFVNHQDIVFAAYYFDAFAKWRLRHSDTPRAWAIAFDAAADRRVSGSGNMILGINAHVQRDLPYVLEALGMVKPDGSSRKADHDQVNRFLNRVTDEAIAEIARRFDPSVDDANAPTTLDEATIFQLVVTWRERAWRNAERLALADTSLARRLVEDSIEATATAEAALLRDMTAYPPGQDSTARDAHCAEHG